MMVFSFPSFSTLLFQIHCFHYHFPCSWGTSALRSTLLFFLRLCLALSIAGMPIQGKQQLQESRHICGLIQSHCRQQETLSFNCNPNSVTTVFSLSNCWMTQINKLNCTSITKYSSSSGFPHFWHTGFGSKSENNTLTDWKKALEKSVAMCSIGELRKWGVLKRGQSRFAGSDTFPRSE